MVGDNAMRFSLSAVIPDFLRYEFVALVVCWAAAVGLFVYAWADYGFASAWPMFGIPLGTTLGLAVVVKLGRMVQREVNSWERVNKIAFGFLLMCLAAETALAILAPTFACLVVPFFLCGLWQLDKTKCPTAPENTVLPVG